MIQFKEAPVVYHGSNAKFENFNPKLIGKNGFQEGIGFYFTTSKRIAEGYAEDGFLYTARLNIAKPLNATEVQITKNELRTLFEALDKELDFLSNWGEVALEGYETIMQKAIQAHLEFSKDDADLISGVFNESGSSEKVLELIYKLLGYDSIIIEQAEWGNGQSIYIALTNEIITITEIEDRRKFAKEIEQQEWVEERKMTE